MRPIRVSITATAANTTGVFTSQSLSAAGSFTLDGSLVSGGVVAFDNPSQVKLAFGANEDGKTYNVTGTILKYGSVVTETLVAASQSATTTNMFHTITDISADAATAGTATGGTTGVESTAWLPIDRVKSPVNVGFSIEPMGTVNYTFQYTFDDIFNPDLDPDATVAQSDSEFTAKTATLNGNIIAGCTAARLLINSGTDQCNLVILQGGSP